MPEAFLRWSQTSPTVVKFFSRDLVTLSIARNVPDPACDHRSSHTAFLLPKPY